MVKHPDSKEVTFLYPFDGRPKALPLV
ncbi:protein of unknown function [Cupriavidus taiwanensis]|nr:protein of unknown function [Cupriavidus taiwanensis]